MPSISAIERIKQLHIPLEQCDFLEQLFGSEKQAVLQGDIRVLIYGAGSAGNELCECLQLHGVYPVGFCDSRAELIGTIMQDLPVIAFDRLLAEHQHDFIVIGTNTFKQEIKAKLDLHGFKRTGWVPDNEQMYYYLNYYTWHFDLANLEQDAVDIQAAYELLEDQRSRDVFLHRLSLLTSYADYRAYQALIQFTSFPADLPAEARRFASNFENRMYFENDVLSLADQETLVDGGAFDGDTLAEFIKAMRARNLAHRRVYCFEADEKNYRQLIKNSSVIDNVSCFNIGLWDRRDRLSFASSDMMFVTEAGIIQQESGSIVIAKTQGDSVIDVDTMDHLIAGQPVSIIKMDIEGAEIQALNGAVGIIEAQRPKLIISAYHKWDDLYRIILLLKQIMPAYRFYIRHFSFSLSETVIFAIAS